MERRNAALSGLVCCSLFGLGAFGLYAAESASVAHAPIAQLEPATFVQRGDSAAIQTFDLSPDGTRIGVLYGVGKYEDETWIAAYDIPTAEIVGRAKLGDNTAPPPHTYDPNGALFNSSYLFQLRQHGRVVFSPNQDRMVVMALGKVWVLDSKGVSIVRVVDPPQFDIVAPVDIQTVSKSVFAVTYEYGYEEFEVNFYDFTMGNRIRGWRSSTIPQSFSPNGQVWVGPDPNLRNAGGVTNVQVADADTGMKLMSIPVGFQFRKT